MTCIVTKNVKWRMVGGNVTKTGDCGCGMGARCDYYTDPNYMFGHASISLFSVVDVVVRASGSSRRVFKRTVRLFEKKVSCYFKSKENKCEVEEYKQLAVDIEVMKEKLDKKRKMIIRNFKRQCYTHEVQIL